jgi:hypothetical protein
MLSNTMQSIGNFLSELHYVTNYFEVSNLDGGNELTDKQSSLQ